MKKLNYVTFILAAALLSACSTSNDVASNKLIQKRKYNKGYHLAGLQKKQQAINPQKDVVNIEKLEVKKTKKIKLPVEKREAILSERSFSASNSSELQLTDLNQEEVLLKSSTLNVLSEKQITKIEKKIAKMDNKIQRKAVVLDKNAIDDEKLLYILLAIFLPFLAVGLVTDWDITKVLISVLLMLLFWLPAIIYAIIIVDQNM